MSRLSLPAGQSLLDTDLALSQIGDADAMQDMLVMLEEALARDLPDISDLLQKGDILGANCLLHAIKGFIPIFCQDALSQEVTRVEAMSKEPFDAGLSDGYAQLRPHLEQLLAEVRAHLANGG